MEYLYKEQVPDEADSDGAEVKKQQETVQPQPVLQPGVKNCRYGLACTRPDCKFAHPEADSATSNPGSATTSDIGTKCANLGISWIPSEMSLNLHSTGKVSYGEDAKFPKKEDQSETATEENETKSSSADVTSSKCYEL